MRYNTIIAILLSAVLLMGIAGCNKAEKIDDSGIDAEAPGMEAAPEAIDPTIDAMPIDPALEDAAILNPEDPNAAMPILDEGIPETADGLDAPVLNPDEIPMPEVPESDEGLSAADMGLPPEMG